MLNWRSTWSFIQVLPWLSGSFGLWYGSSRLFLWSIFRTRSEMILAGSHTIEIRNLILNNWEQHRDPIMSLLAIGFFVSTALSRSYFFFLSCGLTRLSISKWVPIIMSGAIASLLPMIRTYGFYHQQGLVLASFRAIDPSLRPSTYIGMLFLGRVRLASSPVSAPSPSLLLTVFIPRFPLGLHRYQTFSIMMHPRFFFLWIHVWAMDVSLIYVIRWGMLFDGVYHLARNLTCSASTMSFTSKSTDIFLMSMGYVELAAESVRRSTDDITDMRKLAEGGHNPYLPYHHAR